MPLRMTRRYVGTLVQTTGSVTTRKKTCGEKRCASPGLWIIARMEASSEAAEPPA